MKAIHTNHGIVIHSKFQNVAKILPESVADLVFADWPFNAGVVDGTIQRLISDGVKYAHKLLKPNGTLISVNYIEPNFHVWEQVKYWGMTLADSITVLRHPIKKVKHRLGYETLSILVFTKGKIEDRTLTTACRHTNAKYIYSKDQWGITTDFWGELRFKNGYRRKNGDSVPEAMPASTVKRLISTYTVRGDLVIDFFGGAGTVPVICRDLGIRFISTEILPHRFQIIQRRLLETNEKFVRYSNVFANKALELLERAQPYTKGDANGQAENRFEG